MLTRSGLRFAGDPSPENMRRADAWANAAISSVLSKVYQGFGAVQLMVRGPPRAASECHDSGSKVITDHTVTR